jgi:hypothetical protein
MPVRSKGDMLKARGNAIKRAAIHLVAFALVLPVTGLTEESSSRRGSDPNKQRWRGEPAPKQVVLYGFAKVADVGMLSDGPVKETCSHALVPLASAPASKAKPLTGEQEQILADIVTERLWSRLEKTIPVMFAAPPEMPPGGSLVFTGCFVGMDAGNAGKRLVGGGAGASHLAAHIRVFYVDASGSVPFDEFDLAVSGSNDVPAVAAAGLAGGAFKKKSANLEADAGRLADEIIERLNKAQVL